MKKIFIIVLLGASASTAVSTATGAETSLPLKIGGQLMIDTGWIGGSPALEANIGAMGNGAEFRRARISMENIFYDDYLMKAEFDFAGGSVNFKDVYIGLQNIPYLGKIRVGHFKEAVGLEELTSSKWITFLERGLPTVFTPARNLGFLFDHAPMSQRITWGIGLFKEAGDSGNVSDDDGLHATGRFTALPWYEESGTKMLHLGLSFSHQEIGNGVSVTLKEKPELHFAPYVVTTGALSPNRVDLIGLEQAWIVGPASLQTEWISSRLSFSRADAAWLHSGYTQISCFLTGEHRNYKKSWGVFDQVTPRRSFLKEGGPGAWEIAARFSFADLNNASAQGGNLRDGTGGINWYLLRNVRWMLNYIYARKIGIGGAHAVATRMQIVF